MHARRSLLAVVVLAWAASAARAPDVEPPVVRSHVMLAHARVDERTARDDSRGPLRGRGVSCDDRGVRTIASTVGGCRGLRELSASHSAVERPVDAHALRRRQADLALSERSPVRIEPIDHEQASADATSAFGAHRRIVRMHRAELQHCYERELESDDAIAGGFVLELRIESNVRVARAVAVGAPSRALAACVESAARRWTFPSSTDGASFSTPIELVRPPAH